MKAGSSLPVFPTVKKQNKTKKNHENKKSKDELTVQQLKGTSKSELVFIELTHRFHIQNIVIYTDIT